MKQPSKFKMAIVIWIAIYPTINFIFLLFGERLNALPVLLRTLVLTLILVPLMVFVLLPILTKLLGKWLSK